MYIIEKYSAVISLHTAYSLQQLIIMLAYLTIATMQALINDEIS